MAVDLLRSLATILRSRDKRRPVLHTLVHVAPYGLHWLRAADRVKSKLWRHTNVQMFALRD